MSEPKSTRARTSKRRRPAGPPTLLPNPPVKPVVYVEGNALSIIHRGLARNMLTLMLILAAACVLVPFLLGAADRTPPATGTVVVRWIVGGILIGVCLAVAGLFFVRLRRGDDHKVMTLDPGGLHVHTANPVAPARTMTFDEIEGIDIVQAKSNPEMGQARVGRHVRVGFTGKPSVLLNCDRDRDAVWLDSQIRATVEHFTGRAVPEGRGTTS